MPRYPETGLATANMQCTNCHETPGTINILDLDGGAFVGEQCLCSTCAEAAGYVHPKAAPLKISPEMLEDLITGAKPHNAFAQLWEDPKLKPPQFPPEMLKDPPRRLKPDIGSVESEDDDDGSDD